MPIILRTNTNFQIQTHFSICLPAKKWSHFKKKPPEGGLVRIASLLWLDPRVPTVNQNILNTKFTGTKEYILTAIRKTKFFF